MLLNVSYSFTSLASLQGLIQYNRQSSTVSSNIRLALLDRSGTGLFAVYNDRRDTSDVTVPSLEKELPDVASKRTFRFRVQRLPSLCKSSGQGND